MQFQSPEVKQHAALLLHYYTLLLPLLHPSYRGAAICWNIGSRLICYLRHFVEHKSCFWNHVKSYFRVVCRHVTLHSYIGMCSWICMHNEPWLKFLIAECFYLWISFWREHKLRRRYQTQYHQSKVFPCLFATVWDSTLEMFKVG